MNADSANRKEDDLMLKWRGYLGGNRLSRTIGPGDTMEQRCRSVRGEEGSTIVEFALSSLLVFAMLFGIIELSMGLYAYNYVSDAAREATRYAIVRGSQCVNMPDCNITTSAPIQTYIQSFHYPGIHATNLTAVATWFKATGGPPNMTWVACTVAPCNVPGNAVKVVVTYTFPLAIPLVQVNAFTLHSTSQMVISQ
jgi:Flp pilus assembly protein TadG